MMSDPTYECLSMIELLDVKQGGQAPADIQRHLLGCSRCQALLAQIPEDQVEPPEPNELPAPRKREAALAPDRLTSGQLWAVHVDHDWREVVALLGQSPESDKHLLVAPVAADTWQATERDLLLDRDLLGYDCFADVGNAGMLHRAVLTEYRGALAPPSVDALLGLYRHMMGAQAQAPQANTGVPVVDAEDPRLLAANQRAERFQALWRDVLATVDQEEQEASGEVAGEEEVAPATLGGYLAEQLAGAQWDRAALLEESQADPNQFERFLHDDLDLTHRAGTTDLARVLVLLHPEPQELEPEVTATLRVSEGGEPYSSGTPSRMAARSQPGQSHEQITRDLYRGSAQVDRSEDARERQVKAYLKELWEAVDELS